MTNFKLVNTSMNASAFDILMKTLERRLAERNCRLAIENADFTLTIAVDESLANDRFVIEPNGNGVSLRAANSCAIFAALGRWLFDSRFDGRGGFEPSLERVDFTPAKPLRGMYFATHFNNFYHNAPLEAVYEVIADLALRGCNAILVWYDMHHYDSIDEPSSRAMIERLKAFMIYAKKIGMKASMTMLSNEGFNSSPEELRADWEPQGRYFNRLVGHYHREICPSKPGGMEAILDARRRMLEAFRDAEPDYVCFWPYDQGGCTCRDCEPWGANGMLKIFPRFVKLLHEILPETRVIFSTWFFDSFISGEWEEFYPHLKSGELAEADYIMSFFFGGNLPEVIKCEGIPEGVKFIEFPEISMYGCEPWGGFGASPLAYFIERTVKNSGHLYAGGYPYSEGIYEDINKHIMLSFYSGRYETSAEAVREYAKFELCCDDDALVEAILATENAIVRGSETEAHPFKFWINDKSTVESVFATMEAYDKRLPEPIRSSARWMMLYLRALTDYEIAKNDGSTLSEPCQAAFRELYGLYHCSPETLYWVCPPINGELHAKA